MYEYWGLITISRSYRQKKSIVLSYSAVEYTVTCKSLRPPVKHPAILTLINIIQSIQFRTVSRCTIMSEILTSMIGYVVWEFFLQDIGIFSRPRLFQEEQLKDIAASFLEEIAPHIMTCGYFFWRTRVFQTISLTHSFRELLYDRFIQ